MECRKITYTFILSDEKKECFDLKYDKNTLEIVYENHTQLPDWTMLGYKQCPHCSLDVDVVDRCPLAVAISGVVKQFNHVLSYHEVDIEVRFDERVIFQRTTAQRALSSFMGAIMAVSGCPHTNFFRPMARFHLPLANEEETIYRSCAMYMLAQYFRKKKDAAADYSLAGLEDIYKNIQVVNTAIVDRIRSASCADASINAIVMLDMYAKIVPYVLDESLEEIQYLFESYL